MLWIRVTQGDIHKSGVNVGRAEVIEIFNPFVELAGRVVFFVERGVGSHHELLLSGDINKITRLIESMGSTNIDTFFPARHDH